MTAETLGSPQFPCSTSTRLEFTYVLNKPQLNLYKQTVDLKLSILSLISIASMLVLGIQLLSMLKI